MTRKIKYLALFLAGVFVLTEALLATVLLSVPADDIGMRPVLSKVINTSSDALFQSPDTGTIEGVSPEELRRLQSELQAVVSPFSTDLLKSIAVLEWVRARLKPGRPEVPAILASAIIDKALSERRPTAWCDEFAKLYYLCCASVGIRCRIVHLSAKPDGPGALQAHYLNEVWNEQTRSWFAVDPYFGRYFPGLSALEIHAALIGGKTDTITLVQLAGAPPPMELQRYLQAYAHVQVVAGRVFASGNELLLSGKRIIFYNWVDENTPPLRSGYETIFLLGKYIIPSLIALTVLVFLLAFVVRQRKPFG